MLGRFLVCDQKYMDTQNRNATPYSIKWFEDFSCFSSVSLTFLLAATVWRKWNQQKQNKKNCYYKF